MPLGFERINERQKRPNELINFIKPLEGSDKALAQDFLERVAAISYPIMKANYIAVMSLEEYEPNPEFIGRNFNAGEVIQLVLKAPGSGAWLPFRHVQMVMMHELAHCKQMNHSGFFWKVRNAYTKELRDLWGRNYTGEGFWSRGRTLLSGQYTTETLPDATLQPRSLCGGTYRSSRNRKRKRGQRMEKAKVSYAERKQRRILKKFGAGGTVLGNEVKEEDESSGSSIKKGKPRVAASRRGRDLRAAAALARLEKVKDEDVKEEATDSDSTSDDEEFADRKPAIDVNGKKLTDYKGFGLVKVCEEEQENDDNTRHEMDELRDIAIKEEGDDAFPHNLKEADVGAHIKRENLPLDISPEDKSKLLD